METCSAAGASALPMQLLLAAANATQHLATCANCTDTGGVTSVVQFASPGATRPAALGGGCSEADCDRSQLCLLFLLACAPVCFCHVLTHAWSVEPKYHRCEPYTPNGGMCDGIVDYSVWMDAKRCCSLLS